MMLKKSPSLAMSATTNSTKTSTPALSDSRATSLTTYTMDTAAEKEEAAAVVPDRSFTNVADVYRQLELHADTDSVADCLVVGSLSAKNFQRIESERDRLDRHYRLFYLAEHNCAIITIPSGPHEQAHSHLHDTLTISIAQMGLRREWSSMGATKYKPSGGSGSSGEGDSAGGPVSRLADDDWPTLVIESGVSQTMASLRAKAQWWFSASGYRMKVVILTKLFVGQSAMKIEKWAASMSVTRRHGATTTRSASAQQVAACEQLIEISWAGPAPILQTSPNNRVPARFHVSGGPLILRFEDLFLRAPVASAGEHDIVISQADLADLAAHVWMSVRM